MAAAAIAADAGKPPSSSSAADSYIGSFISLISKSDIRYQGFLFHLNPQESVIGLRNVKSFGTEGRRKDGPQILPIDKVYEYIFFRGSDIKDLQVISSPPVQGTPSVPDDPAIIQPHYPHPPSVSTSVTSAGTAPVTNIGSHAQLGIPVSTFQGNLHQYESVEHSGNWGSSLPPTANSNGLDMPKYWPGSTVSSGGITHSQQQPLPPPPKSLVLSSLVQQPIKPPSMSSSLVGHALNLVAHSCSSLPPVHKDSPNSTSTGSPPSAFASNLPSGQSSTPASTFSPNLKPNNELNALHTVKLGPSSPPLPSLATNLNVNAIVPLITGKHSSVFGPALPYQSMAQSMPSVVATTAASLGEKSIQTLMASDQLLPPGVTTPSVSRFSQNADEVIETIQASTSEPPFSDTENVQEPEQQLPSSSSSAEKLNGVALPSHHSKRHHAQGRGNWPNGAALHTYRSNRGHGRGRGNMPNGAASHNRHDYRRHTMGRENALNGAAFYPHHSNRGYFRGREDGRNGAPLRAQHYADVHGQEKGTKMSPTVINFTEDFDFEAMNKKFNKEEVWDFLDKSNKSGYEDKEVDGNESDKSDRQEEAGDGLPNLDNKSVYCKDDFFDSLSCNPLYRESGRGKVKLAEQRRLDTETFGEFQRHRLGCSIHGPGRVGRSRGSYRGRGYGHAGRGRGRTVWCRVT